MHAKYKILSMVVAMPVIAILSLAGGNEAASLIENGNMETAAPTGWEINRPNDATGSITSVAQPTKTGQQALLLKGLGAWMSANSRQVAIDSKARYRATAWIRAKKGHARIQFDHFENGKWLGSHSDQVRVVTDEWTQVTLESALEKYPSVTHVSIAIVSDGPGVEVYVDNVAMTVAPEGVSGPNNPSEATR